jgi:hypothetical protein
MKNLQVIFLLFVFVNLSCYQKDTQRITSIFTADDSQSVLFKLQNGNTDTLISNKEKVFFVMSNSDDNKWVLISEMPADPDEAHGSNSIYKLYFVPKKKEIKIKDLGLTNEFNFISIETIKNKAYVIVSNGPDEKKVLLK